MFFEIRGRFGALKQQTQNRQFNIALCIFQSIQTDPGMDPYGAWSQVLFHTNLILEINTVLTCIPITPSKTSEENDCFPDILAILK